MAKDDSDRESSESEAAKATVSIAKKAILKAAVGWNSKIRDMSYCSAGTGMVAMQARPGDAGTRMFREGVTAHYCTRAGEHQALYRHG
jgi:hypothetical protein